MKLRNKLIAAGLCAGMSLTLLTGCASKPDNNATVATVGDTKLSLGVANLMLRYTQASTGTYLKAMLGTEGSIWDQDLVGNGTPYGQTLKDSVMSEYETMVVLEEHMGDYGVEISDEEKAAIDAAADQFIADNSKEALEQMSATKENVARLLTLYTIEHKMQKAVEDSADVTVTDEEAAQKKIRYAYFAIPKPEEEETEAVTEAAEETEAVTEATEETEAVTESAGETEEATEVESETEAVTEEGFEETPERAATREEVQAIISEVKAGKTLDEAVAAYDPEKKIMENTFGQSTTSISGAIIKAAERLSDGEICDLPAEVESGFYIVEMVSTYDEEATEKERERLLEQRKNEFYNETVASWRPENIEVDEKVWGEISYLDDFYLKETEAASEAAEEETEAVSETEVATEAVSETESEA